jgi:head-tail adaptor
MVPFAAMSRISIERQALTDDQLEQLVREWTSHKKEYVEVQRFSGPGTNSDPNVGRAGLFLSQQ